MKRILVLNYEFPPLGGGASPVSYELAKRLSETGEYDIDVVTMGFKGLPRYEEVNSRMRIHRVPCIRSKKELCYPWEQLSYLVSGYFMCRNLLKKQKFDLSHAHFIIPTGVLSYVLKKQFGIPYVITAHGSDVPGFNRDRFVGLHKFTGPLLSAIIRNARSITAPSDFLKGLILRNILNTNSEEIAVIPNGLHVEEPDFSLKKKIIFTSGRLLPRKGFQYLVEAVSESDLGWEVHIAGDGPILHQLQKAASNSKTKIVFHGWINNKGSEYRKLLQESSLFVFMSDMESFGMVIVEAMSSGLAVITTDTPVSHEVVGKSGIYVPAQDSLALKNEIVAIINDPYILNSRGKENYRRALRFDWEAVLKDYKQIL